MTDAEIANLKRILTNYLNNEGRWTLVNELFDRSWNIIIDQQGKHIRLTLETRPTDNEVWTASDVAVYLHQDRDKIIRWCGTRARQEAKRAGKIPIPFKKQDAKTVLFSRKDVMDWWSRMEPAVLATFVKGKVKR